MSGGENEPNRPLLITFSGLDGSGKTTQIENLREHLYALGLRAVQLAFWDDVVVGKRYREGFVHKVYGSEKGVGEPGKAVNRQDKNVRKWYLSLARHLLYFVDAIQLCEVVHRARRGSPDVVLMDRYIYDEFANLPLQNWMTRWFVRRVHRLVPKPDVAYFLDADVEAARARKPEYPLEFMRESREAYLGLARELGSLTVVLPLPLEQAREAVVRIFDQAISNARRSLHTAAA